MKLPYAHVEGVRGIVTPEEDCPGVIARPPRLYMGFLSAGVVLNYFWPASAMANAVPRGARYAIGLGLFAAGVLIMAAAMRQFRRAGTHVETHRPTTALVTDGLFARSRNPIYVALTLMYAGSGIVLDNAWILGLLVPLLLIMRYGVIVREERYLEAKFGERYGGYKASVRRWL